MAEKTLIYFNRELIEGTEEYFLFQNGFIGGVDMNNNKQRKVVEIVWFDAQSSLTPIVDSEVGELQPLLSKSVGYLLEENRSHIVLGSCDFGDGLIKLYQLIPRKMIKLIKVLRDGFVGSLDDL